jgi:hypothetical protein
MKILPNTSIGWGRTGAEVGPEPSAIAATGGCVIESGLAGSVCTRGRWQTGLTPALAHPRAQHGAQVALPSNMSLTTILIIVLIVMLLGGGGYYWRR